MGVMQPLPFLEQTQLLLTRPEKGCMLIVGGKVQHEIGNSSFAR